MADAATYAEAVNEGLANEGLAPRYTQQEIEAYRSGKYPTLFPNVDWFNETLRDHGQRDQVNFTASGGSNRIRYYSMINFISDRGLLKEYGSRKLFHSVSQFDTQRTYKLGYRHNIVYRVNG